MQSIAQLQQQDGRLLISYEGLSISARELWEGTGTTPLCFARNLAAILAAPQLSRQPLRFIVGIRRQSSWLASRYAQSAKKYPEFSPADFESRVEGFHALSQGPAAQWLHYNQVYQSLSATFPSAQLLFLPLEALSHNPAGYIQRVTSWLECPSADAPVDDAPPCDMAGLRNGLSTEANVWVLPNGNGRIHLSPAMGDRIDSCYSSSNRAFAQLTGLPLADLGYHVG